MLIVLRDGPHLELSRTQAGVHTEIPAGTRPQEPQVGDSAIRLQKGPQTSSPWWRTRVTNCQSCKELDISSPVPSLYTNRNETQRRKGSAGSEGARTVKTSYNFLKLVHLSTLPRHSTPPTTREIPKEKSK